MQEAELIPLFSLNRAGTRVTEVNGGVSQGKRHEFNTRFIAYPTLEFTQATEDIHGKAGDTVIETASEEASITGKHKES